MCLFLLTGSLAAQTTFYDLNSIQKIELYFSQSNWDYQLDTSKYGADGYVVADWVKINGVQFDSVGVKYKGNSSYDSTYLKNPVHIEIDHVINQSYQGIKDIKLGNGYADPSMIREVLAYDILQNYMNCPRSNFAQLYINGNYTGVYSNTESINKDFLSSQFSSSSNTFFKCNPIVTPGPTTKSNLKYISNDSSNYFNYYELKSNTGWEELVRLCDTITNFPASVGNNIDMDRAIWMLAFNSVLVNLDSYSGVFCQNYYLYKDNTGRFNPIVWDLNMAFGGFPFAGSGASSMGSLTVANMQQFSPVFHGTDPYWPLIKAVISDPSYKKQYIAHANTILSEVFSSGNYLSSANNLQSIVDTAAQSDNNLFFPYSQFQNAINTDYPFSSYVIPGISNLMNARIAYLLSTPEFQMVPPVISGQTVSNTAPQLNDVVTFTANVTNANSSSVYFGYRGSQTERFDRVLMYDDGAHGDGSAGDNVYGISITVSSLVLQYYFYAENNDAGVFSPTRAEHEFNFISTVTGNPDPGEVVINEFLAWNVTDVTNETGLHADWIELYNNTSTPLSLYGSYLSDDFTNPTKWAFPANTIIDPYSFLMIWADEDPSTASFLHCNFKLSSSGEQLMLSNGNGVVIDSLTFGTQFDDISFGRCPNGTGAFTDLYPTSFSNYNCSGTGLTESGSSQKLLLYPVPANNIVYFVLPADFECSKITVSDLTGRIVMVKDEVLDQKLDIEFLVPGFYLISFFNQKTGKTLIGKIHKI